MNIVFQDLCYCKHTPRFGLELKNLDRILKQAQFYGKFEKGIASRELTLALKEVKQEVSCSEKELLKVTSYFYSIADRSVNNTSLSSKF